MLQVMKQVEFCPQTFRLCNKFQLRAQTEKLFGQQCFRDSSGSQVFFFFWSLLESKRLMVYVWFLDGNAQNVTCFLSEIVKHHTMCFADSQNNNLSAGSEFYT